MLKKMMWFILCFIVVTLMVNVLLGTLENPWRLLVAYLAGLVVSGTVVFGKNRK